MAFGSSSAVFVQAVLNPLCRTVNAGTAPTGFTSLTNASEVFCALFGNTGTPNKTDTLANTGYNTGQWVTGNESSGTNYTAGGSALSTFSSLTFTVSSNSVAYAQTTGPSWTSATITAYGCLVYDNNITAGTVAKQGMCFNSFGGSAQTVSAGTFTIAWNAAGIFNFSV